MNTTPKKDNRGYEPPALIVIGSMADLTAGVVKSGSDTDYPCGCRDTVPGYD